jgi:hypothetical protein
MARLTLTPEMARAAGRDAANVRMRAAGRTAWNRADYNTACRVTAKLMACVEGRYIQTLSPVAQTLMARHEARIRGAA